MKIGVSSYSYHKLVSTGKMDILDVVRKAAEMGFEVIEIAGFATPEGTTPAKYAEVIRKVAEESKIEIGNYTIAGNLITGCDGNLEAEIERLCGEVDIAEILGSKSMRHDAGWGVPEGMHEVGFWNYLPRMIEGCTAVTEYAQKKGIRTMVENHGTFAQDSTRVERLVTGVAHPNFGALVDMGNFLCADEDPQLAVGRMMPHAFHVHAKDFHVKSGDGFNPGNGFFMSRAGNYLRGAIIGQGNVPLIGCLRAMKRANYDGILSIEFEGIEDPILGISTGLENLKRAVAQVYGE